MASLAEAHIAFKESQTYSDMHTTADCIHT